MGRARWILAIWGLVASAVVAGAEPVGPEFRLNSYLTQRQTDSAVARLVNGGFVAVWTSYRQDGSGDGVYGQRYTGDGQPIGSEFQVNATTLSSQRWAAVAGLNNGGFVAVWNSTGQDGSGEGVFGQRYDRLGAPTGGEFRINSYTASSQLGAAVAGLSGGGFVVAWTSHGQDDFDNGVFGQRYDHLGAPTGGEFQIASASGINQSTPKLAAFPGNRFVATWLSFQQDGSSYGIFGRRFGAAGVPLGGEFRVNSVTAGDQLQSSVAALTDGSFVVAWTDTSRDGSSSGIYARRFDAAGAPASGDFRINTTTALAQNLPAIAGLAGGGFAAAWASDGQDGSGLGIYGREYDSAGAPVGREFRINTYTSQTQSEPAVAALAGGGYVVTWTSLRTACCYFDISGQRFE